MTNPAEEADRIIALANEQDYTGLDVAWGDGPDELLALITPEIREAIFARYPEEEL